MKKIRQNSGLIMGLFILALSLIHSANAAAPPAASLIFTVNTTADPGNGVCDVAECTLREAIMAANANADPDTIAFNIPGPGPHTIRPTSALPAITDPVVIDGYTQPGASPNSNAPGLGLNTVLMIELDGSNAGPTNVDGLQITTANSTIRGLVINRFSGDGLALFGSGAIGNLVEGNFIGVNVAGDTALGNGGEPTLEDLGVRVGSLASQNVVQDNLISGNFDGGLSLDNGAFDNTIRNNLIGTDVDGLLSIANHQKGLTIQSDARDNLIQNNLISGNNGAGVVIGGTSDVTGNRLEGNFIGADITGLAALPNATNGVLIFAGASNNLVGGTTTAARNLISGNDAAGIIITGAGTTGNLIQGNYIGTDVTGAVDLGNTASGIFIADASDNTIGGTTTGAGNLIAFNGLSGFSILGGAGNFVSSNAIVSNEALGIDLGFDGLTANDAGDLDVGSNQLQNFPILLSAPNGSPATITGTLNSAPNTTFRLEFFANASCDPAGNGEGETFLGSTLVTTTGTGEISFTFLTPVSTAQPFFTATATDPANNTSEFSPCRRLTLQTFLPIILH